VPAPVDPFAVTVRKNLDLHDEQSIHFCLWNLEPYMVAERDTTNMLDLGFWVLLRKSSRDNMGHMIT